MRLGLFHLRRFRFLDPGRLVDGELELVRPHARWADDLLAACQHPLTRRDMPGESQTTRQQIAEYLEAGPCHRRGPAGVPQYDFWMLLNDSSDGRAGGAPSPPRLRVAGGVTLRVGQGPAIERYYGHIGYHVFPPARGNHYAERACRLLFPLARRHGLRTVWITCNPDNAASRRTCERLGMALVDVVPVPPDEPLYARGDRAKCRYRVEL